MPPSLLRLSATLTFLLLLAAARLAARTDIPLNENWRFALRPTASAPQAVDFDDSGWKSVELPHCWNAIDGADGGANYVRGDGWYRRTFDRDPAWQGSRVWIEFGGASRVAEVWLNGQRLGEHRGAYARFRFDLTDALRDGRNVLAVRVNNEPDDIVPIDGDFTMWGGLHRAVKLIVVPAAHLALGDHGSCGVFLIPGSVSAAAATVDARTEIESNEPEPFAGTVTVTVRDAEGLVVAAAEAGARVARGERTTVDVPLRIVAPHRWDGREDPYLYHVTVQLRAGDRVLDAVEQPLGLRTITVDPDHGLFLNGRHYAVHGVNRHHDRIDRGLAITRANQREDFRIIEEMGATAVRLCHYQHDDYAYQLADEAGLLIWAEVPFVGRPPQSAAGQDNALEQLRELIRQNYNHPSIFCWSVGNETHGDSDPLLVRLAAVVKQEDPTRLSTYASDAAPNDPRNDRTDIVGYNRYFGWYGGKFEELGPWLDQWHATHPKRPLGMSEYGAGASIYEHEQNPPVRKGQAGGPWHPEELQSALHEASWLTLKQRPWLWGTFIWCMFDFGADHRGEGDTLGRNDKGLVTYDRRTRKDAYFWYQANWTTVPMVYITSRRDSLRVEPKTGVKVYSNCDSVELWVNGRSLGVRQSVDHRFIWPDVTLEHGPNRLRVLATKGDAQVSDSCAWTLTTGTPYRP